MSAVTPPVTSVTLNGTPLTLGELEWSVAVQHGRNDIGSTPEPSSCQIVSLQTGDTSITGTVGDTVVVTARSVVRFTGTVTDIDIAHVPGTVPLTRVTMLCIGKLPILADLTGGGAGYTAQTAAARVAAIMDPTGLTYTATNVDAAFDLVAYAANEQTVSQLLADVLESTGGTYTDLPNGSILIESYTKRGYVSGSAPTPVSLPAAGVLWEPVWKQTIGTIRTSATVGYGTGSPQSTVTVADTAAETIYGDRPVTLASMLANVDDATSRAGNIVAAQSRATWSLQQVSIMLDLLTAPQRTDVLALVSGSRVEVTDLPQPAPDTDYIGVVEGWGESITPAGHVLTLSLSDPRHSNAMLLWSAIPTGETWSTIPTARQWADLVSISDL